MRRTWRSTILATGVNPSVNQNPLRALPEPIQVGDRLLAPSNQVSETRIPAGLLLRRPELMTTFNVAANRWIGPTPTDI